MSGKFFFPQRPPANPQFHAYYQSQNPPDSAKAWYRGPLKSRKDRTVKPWEQTVIGKLVALGFLEKVEERARPHGKQGSP